MSLDLSALIALLNPPCREALERAAQRCLIQTHFYIEIEHVLLELIDAEKSDFVFLLPHLGLNRDALASEINTALERFKRGNTRTPAFSPHTIRLLESAVVYATVSHNQRVRSGMLLQALLENEELRNLLMNGVSSLLAINRDSLRSQFNEWTAGRLLRGTARR